MTKLAVHTPDAPRPAGTYSQAVVVGNLLFVSGQTPRDRSGARLSEASFDEQVKRVLDNINEIAKEVGLSLKDAVKVSVFLKEAGRAADFDRIYRYYVESPFPARTLVPALFVGFELEVDAVLAFGD